MKLETLRHSLAHIMALAVQELYPKVKFGIGPAIENGFYYDFDNLKITDSDLKKIESKIKELINKKVLFKKKIVSKAEALKLFKNQPYKKELIKDAKSKISIYKSDDFVDLCKGPHVKSSKEINFKAFKLTRLAGAYWKGSEKNKMLTRIYGIAFKTPKELRMYEKQQQEAEKRDHRKLGKRLDLFSFHDQAPGMPFFHPRGTIIYKELWKFWEEAQKEFDYDMMLAPSMLDISIWKQSGHWSHYKDDMFFIKGKKGEKDYALRPMDCPGAILIYNNSLKSYRDLPLRYAEPGLISRKEKSGQLGGLFRVQQFRQDDAHLFLTEDQIEQEIKSIIKLVDKIYKKFGLKYKAYLSTRPDDYMGDIKLWNKAEAKLKKILKQVYKNNYSIKEKDGAFYGPKIDYDLEDALGRTWQCATIQLDFQMPLKFKCKYIDKNGKKKIPVMIHRTIMGSFERFMGILLEHYAGALPFWLSPEQIWILPISRKHNKYASLVSKQCSAKIPNLRIKIINTDETLGKKIREAEIQKIPYLIILGDKEIKNKTINLRSRDTKKQEEIKLEKFLKLCLNT
ncbi:threonine--tRNA ligase [bacterium]|nr:threonine--tRNA ligase [bacterium]